MAKQSTVEKIDMKSNLSPIYILGAGPAGLAAAYALTKQGQSVVVVDKDTRVGGLSKSIEHQGFILDYGSHFLSTKPVQVLELFNEILGTEQVNIKRVTRVYWRGKYFSYPPKIFEVLFGLKFFESIKLIFSYILVRIFRNTTPQNYAEQVTAKFGKYLFESFFKDYTEKLWGVSCTELSANTPAGRVNDFFKSFIKSFIGSFVKTLPEQNDGQFQYPRLGLGQFYEGIADYLRNQNQKILLNTEVVQIQHNDFQVTQVTLKNCQTGQEETHECWGVVSSIPLSLLIQQIAAPAPERILVCTKSLKFRNTVLVYLIVEGSQLFPDHCLYINDQSVLLVRVTNYANWSRDTLPNLHQTPLCCEYWCNFDEPLWQRTEPELLIQAEGEIRKIGLLHNEKISSGFVVRLPRTNPIYTTSYQADLLEIQDYLKQFQNLQVVGRGGSFSYYDQDRALLTGFSIAENILKMSNSPS